jgi:hypothetical protein
MTIPDDAGSRPDWPEKRDKRRAELIVGIGPVNRIRNGVETGVGDGSGDSAAEEKWRVETLEPQFSRDFPPGEPRETGRIRERRGRIVGGRDKRARRAAGSRIAAAAAPCFVRMPGSSPR